jgi:hypothetical protein
VALGSRSVAPSLGLQLLGVILLSLPGLGAPALAAADAGADIVLRISGSSAQENLLEGLLRLRPGSVDAPALCAEGSLEVFSGAAGGTKQRVYRCRTTGAVQGVPAGRILAVFKSSGGSGEGVSPLMAERPMPFLPLQGIGKRCTGSSRELPTGDLAAFTQHKVCEAEPDLAVPDAGISDLEPSLLADGTGELVAHPLSQLVWGLPVSRNFRNALQALQGLVPASVPHDDPQRETLAAMPGLSSAQVRSIFAGAVTHWSMFYDEDGVAISRSPRLPDPPEQRELSGTSPGAYRPDANVGDAIYVCRRIESSGTQIAHATHYLRQRCTADAPLFVAPDDGSSPETGGSPGALVGVAAPQGRIFAGRGSGDVRRCLDLHDDHNRWAVGMLSTENIGNYLGSEYRHIRIDGYAPTLLNAHRGLWRHVSTASMQWRRDRETQWPVAERSVLNYLARYMGQPAVLRSLNRVFRHAWGDGGYLAPPRDAQAAAGAQVTAEALRRYPVAGVSYERMGEPRNCLAPLISGRSSIDLR